MPKRKRWQKLGLGLCLLGVLAFATPLAGGILGLANGSAMAGFLLLAAAIWWWEPVSKLLAFVCKSTLFPKPPETKSQQKEADDKDDYKDRVVPSR